MNRFVAWLTGRPAPCCDGCAGGGGCAGATVPAPVVSSAARHRRKYATGEPVWSSWSWHGRMVLDAEHWIPRPLPRSPLSTQDWANLQESAAADFRNLFGRAYLTMPLTYKAGPTLPEIYGENLYAPRPFGYPQPTPSATWSAPPIGLISQR